MIEPWQIVARDWTEEAKSRFPRFPAAIAAGAGSDPQTMFNRFLQLTSSLQGSINVPTSVVTDFRLRLIQLHEYIHAYHYLFAHETRARMRAYLDHLLAQGVLHCGDTIAAPVLARNADIAAMTAKYGPPIAERDDGAVFVGAAPIGEVLRDLILAQQEELFADFFAGAVAGGAYWSTLVDFETDLLETPHDELLQSEWHPQYPELFEPHPVTWIRLRHFARLCGEVAVGALPGLPVHQYVVGTWLGQHFNDHIAPRLPKVDEARPVVMVNPSAPASIREIRIPIAALLPFYRAAFDALTVILNDWCKSHHGMAMFSMYFSHQYHARVQELATTFPRNKPKAQTVLDSVAGASAARIAYDREPSRYAKLQKRADEFARATKNGFFSLRWQ